MAAATPSHPPRPRLTVRVSVTGHRWNKMRRSDAPAVEARIGEVLARIEDVVAEVHRDLAAGYRSRIPDGPEPPPPDLRLVCGLAEGTDRLAADAAHRRGWALPAPPPPRPRPCGWSAASPRAPTASPPTRPTGAAGRSRPSCRSRASCTSAIS